jgi:hypothetical protein
MIRDNEQMQRFERGDAELKGTFEVSGDPCCGPGHAVLGPKKVKLVVIEWLDSFGCSSTWTSLSDCKPQPLRCKSVGWLLHDGDDCKVLVPHIAQENGNIEQAQGCGDMTIPTAAILSIRELPDEKKAADE